VAPLSRWAMMRRLQKLITGAHVVAYRMLGGRIVGRLGPAPILLLTTTGRRTRRRRTTPLIYLEGADPALVASNGGASTNPQWYLNLEVDPLAEVGRGRDRRSVLAETVDGELRTRLWAQAVEIYPAYATYQANTQRQIPVVLLREIQ
jgi:F420H(2)-dependent quinone reductase